MERQERQFESEGESWRALVARRGPSGHALLYFLPLGGDGPQDDDRRDRRSGLDPGVELAELTVDELRERLDAGTPLTETERRFRAPDGRSWLAQSTGPVWAEDDVAAGLTGVMLTSLEGAPERLVGPGGHVGRMTPADLRRCWRAAAGEGGDAEGSSPAASGGATAGEAER